MEITVPVARRKCELLAGDPLKPSVALSGSLSRKLSSGARCWATLVSVSIPYELPFDRANIWVAKNASNTTSKL